MQPRIHIFLVDDHTLFLQGLTSILANEADFEVVGISSTLDDALPRITELNPEVVLLDIFPGKSGADLLDLLPEDCPTQVLILTASNDALLVAGLLQKGARGAVSKTSDSEILTTAIRRIHSGERYVDEFFLNGLISAIPTSAMPETNKFITDRERDILDHVCAGLSNKEIAERLSISEPAVKAGLQKLFLRFNVRSRAQLVASTTAKVSQHPAQH